MAFEPQTLFRSQRHDLDGIQKSIDLDFFGCRLILTHVETSNKI